MRRRPDQRCYMSASAQIPDPRARWPNQPRTARRHPLPTDGSAKLPGKEESRWSDAVKPLPAVLKQLEGRKLTVTILLFVFLILKVIVPAKGDIPTALAIFQTTSLAVTVIGAFLSALPLLAVRPWSFSVTGVGTLPGRICAGSRSDTPMFLPNALASLRPVSPGSNSRIHHEATATTNPDTGIPLAEVWNAINSCSLPDRFRVRRRHDNMESFVRRMAATRNGHVAVGPSGGGLCSQ